MRQTAISFPSKGLTLEGVISTPEGLKPPYPAVLLCHGLPALGESMESTVILALARAIDDRGIATLRFNFRGVGNSQGEITSDQEEWQDVVNALKVLRRWPGMDNKRLAVAGYSFGAQAIVRSIADLRDAKAFALVSPLSSIRAKPVKRDKRPLLFLVGERDRLASAQKLLEMVSAYLLPTALEVIPGADHTWRGYEDALAQRVAAFLAKHLQ